MNPITATNYFRYSDNYRSPLSNFYPWQLNYDGIIYPTIEHAYQATKTTNVANRMWIAGQRTPADAKRFGRGVVLRPDWESIKLHVMLELLRIKFYADGEPQRFLLSTSPQWLHEGNNWGDTYWGIDDKSGRGHNWLGFLLMGIRAELQAPDGPTR